MLSRESINNAVDAVRAGGVIAYPTESVYGLGCDPDNNHALNQILAIKRREAHKGLIILVSQIEQAFPYIQKLSSAQLEQITQIEPRATTWLIPRQANVSELLCGQHPKLAVRITQHPVANAICEELNSALVSTSCNLAGEEALTSELQVKTLMPEGIDYVVGGEVGGQSPSRIVDIETGVVVRE
ncbi:L-threonylcarbamoyladenylate synthase [Aliikangiella coralliicola]|uniref:Threonylcarbamoyl-AMP synthase n=1 Tax=Aliikangiella coralliicola TaxID=2592383 RepID=A0A545UFW1_9GAMM|nr:L-threonylcarbamoyladenylate synthase [Aliikangiella coralliicola]TQV88360.1 threonylcarbamoyl-AMP synthase [Aliikangiella coralliicola]